MFEISKCVYIAEMMVAANHKGQGIGSELLGHFFNTIDSSIFTDAFIRVWDQNHIALHLYQKMGFKVITQIDQVKNSPDGTFIMKKIYLHKKIK